MAQKLSPTTEEWHNLYAAIAKIKAMAPWEFREESDVVGVQNPETLVQFFVVKNHPL